MVECLKEGDAQLINNGKKTMKCPICGKNEWTRVVKKEPIGVSLATRTVIIYRCGNCGYEKKSPDE